MKVLVLLRLQVRSVSLPYSMAVAGSFDRESCALQFAIVAVPKDIFGTGIDTGS